MPLRAALAANTHLRFLDVSFNNTATYDCSLRGLSPPFLARLRAVANPALTVDSSGNDSA